MRLLATVINKFRALTLQMRIRLMHFVAPSLSGLSKDGVLQAYQSATSLVLHFISDDSAYNVLPHVPVATARTILGAVMLMWRVLNSSFCDAVDRNHGKILFHSAAFALRSLAYHDNDVAARGARAMNKIWKMGEDQPELRQVPPFLRLNSRKSASLLWDAFSRIPEYKEWQEKLAHGDKSKLSLSTGAFPPTSTATAAGTAENFIPRSLGALPLTSDDPNLWMSVPDLDWLWETNLTGLFDL